MGQCPGFQHFGDGSVRQTPRRAAWRGLLFTAINPACLQLEFFLIGSGRVIEQHSMFALESGIFYFAPVAHRLLNLRASSAVRA